MTLSTTTVSENPLKKHFRTPAIFLKLPSQGLFWPEGALELNETKEIPVFPMTTQDEVILKIPDGVLNGESTAAVIRSCCPNIKNPWAIPAVDLDAILIAIRIASYGNEMEFGSNCPNCNHENSYAADLNFLLTKIQLPDYSSTLKHDGLTFVFKPQDLKQLQSIGHITFEEEMILKTLADDSIDNDKKATIIKMHTKKMIDLNIEVLTNNTKSIQPDGEEPVYDSVMIADFYRNTGNNTIKVVQEKLQLFSNKEIFSLQVKCTNCDTSYKNNLDFNYTNFFV